MMKFGSWWCTNCLKLIILDFPHKIVRDKRIPHKGKVQAVLVFEERYLLSECLIDLGRRMSDRSEPCMEYRTSCEGCLVAGHNAYKIVSWQAFLA